ncbi:nuclear transport factor 2 family protein [Hahella aquimaris]|uniref:nuclear transport factor 2 family protein n=1 Tax=Hahella sp. HNIBRBA332 TaxID=3015983 RepID=UPI00273AE0A2|nr:nuclear transport factor 2 family protein [Hahella sp. HNIBRBA332]WLQ12757.1 nuclear transport factor 2 family protein [Hahella sp. HNIBRBA332]
MAILRNSLSAAFAGLLSACSSSGPLTPHQDYLKAAGPETFSSTEQEPRLQGFVALMNNFTPDNIPTAVKCAYAKSFYFNDTFHSLQEREELTRYFVAMAEKASTSVQFLDFTSTGDDILLRWTMTLKFKVWWKQVEVTSIGVSHLRFNAQGEIVLHQDYWDSAEGFYYHLPLLGGVLQKIRSGVGANQ